MVRQLKAIWNGGEIYDLTAGPKLLQFKQLLIQWLENVLASRTSALPELCKVGVLYRRGS